MVARLSLVGRAGGSWLGQAQTAAVGGERPPKTHSSPLGRAWCLSAAETHLPTAAEVAVSPSWRLAAVLMAEVVAGAGLGELWDLMDWPRLMIVPPALVCGAIGTMVAVRVGALR